jgi:single-strand DNA-binding protein
MEITGIIKRISKTMEVSAQFKKREVVITTAEQYPQQISIECHQDKVSLLDGLSEGQEVTIGINIRGREWTSPQGEVRFFNTIVGWKVDKASQAPAPSQPSAPKTAPALAPLADGEDDLPF